VLFSDEVYRGLEPDPARTLLAAVDAAERGISLDVTSKSLGLPGLRVGWLACRDRALLARLEQAKHWTSICNAGPSEAFDVVLESLPRSSAPPLNMMRLLGAWVVRCSV